MPEPKRTYKRGAPRQWQPPGVSPGAGNWWEEFWRRLSMQGQPTARGQPWFGGGIQPTVPTALTAPQHFPGAPGQTYTIEQPTLTPQEQQVQDMMRIEQETAQIQLELLKQQLAGRGAGGQVPQWVTANQQAVMRTMARQYQGMEEQVTKAQQRQMETQWELQRQQMLGQLNTPGDWIKRWMLQQKANPYKPRPRTPDESVAQIRGEIAKLEEEGPERFRNLVDPYGEGGGEWDTETEIEISKAYQSQLKNLGRQYEQALKVQAEWGGGGEVSPRPKTPPTPPWLAQWYPQQLQTGQPIKQLPIATPSMQWWERQPESAKQGWLGFAEYSGATPMDVLSEMQRQLLQPKQPTQRSTARQRTWV